MFLTKECDYAIRIVRELADMEKKSVKTICDREQVPRPFAYKILKRLENAGLVSASRGTAGGYTLVKSPDNVTLLEIVKAVDSRLFLNECLLPGYSCPHNSNGNYCGVHKEFSRVQKLLIYALNEKSITDII